MLAAAVEADFQCQFRTGFATHQGPGPSTRRPARPGCARFVAWLSVGRILAIINLVWSFAAEGDIPALSLLLTRKA